MTRWLYSLVLWLMQPMLRRKLRKRAVAEPGYGECVEERFGHYSIAPVTHGDAHPVVWVHAVSLGETRAAAVLIAQLRLQFPGMRLLLTHGTATGRQQGVALLQEGDLQVWQPWDTPAAVGRFLRHFRPRVGLLMETEVWPNLVAGCRALGVPLCLVNARLSDKSLQQAQRMAWLAKPAYAALRAVWAQTEDDAQRLRLLGAPVAGVMGNLKYDATPDSAQLEKGRAWHGQQARPVVMFASSREGEEAQWLDAVRQQPRASEVQWLLVPRHPQRFDEVAALCEQAGMRVSRRSTWSDAPHACDVWLGDSLGEMALYYGLSDVVLLGGSFAPLGGQNLIEAAACGCPVVMGPHTFNFAQAAEQALRAGAALRVEDMTNGVERAIQWVGGHQALNAGRKAARRLERMHRGAAERTALAVVTLLG